MNGNCHALFGAAVSTSIAINLHQISNLIPNISDAPEGITLMILGGIVGSIFPDIDNPTSYMGRLSSPVSNLIGTIGSLTGKTGSHHRGLLHDPAVYIIGLVLCYFYFTPLLGFFIGCLSHLFLDMFNPSGVPFLFGFKKRMRFMKIPSGSTQSVILTWVNVVMVIAFGILYYLGIAQKYL